MPIRSWLRPSLRYGSVSTIAVRPQRLRDRARRRPRRRSRWCPTTARALRRVGDERRRELGLLGPVVQPSGRVARCARPPSQPAVAEHPVDLVGQQEQGRDAPGCCSVWSLPRVVHRGRQVQERRDPAAGRLDLGDPGQRGRATRARATGRRRRRSPSAARSSRRRSALMSTGRPPAAAGRVDQHQRVVVDPAGRATGAMTPVEVSLCGQRVDVDAVARRPAAGASPGSALDRPSARPGTARPSRRRRTSRRTRRSVRCCDCAAGSGRRWRRPRTPSTPPLPSTTS